MSQSSQSRQYIHFNETRKEYGYLSNTFPSPFNAYDNRWRTVEHYFQGMKTNDLNRRKEIRDAISASVAETMGDDLVLTVVRSDWEETVITTQATTIASSLGVPAITRKDLVMLDGITLKFLQNPELGLRLKDTFPRLIIFASEDEYWGLLGRLGRNMLGKLLVYLRDNILPKTYGREKDNNDITLTNLELMLLLQGYTIPEPLTTETRGLEISGANGYAIIDIYISEKYPESRLKLIIERYKNDDPKPAYIIVGYIDKGNLSKIINRIATFNNIKYYSPSELLVTAQNHVLNPPVRILKRDDPLYTDEKMRSLPEISVNNKLSKDLGLQRGDVIEVMDFSPHYRICV